MKNKKQKTTTNSCEQRCYRNNENNYKDKICTKLMLKKFAG